MIFAAVVGDYPWRVCPMKFNIRDYLEVERVFQVIKFTHFSSIQCFYREKAGFSFLCKVFKETK